MKKIIIGLGNPGKEYQQTRHNAGFMFLDYLQTRLSLPAFSLNKKIQAKVSVMTNLLLVKPQTFMNLSGEAVKKTLMYFCDNFTQATQQSELFNNLFIVHDDLDLEVGQYKIQQGVGPKQHNGLLSIYQVLGTQGFWHVRIGVDDRDGSRVLPSEKYVLQKLTKTQLSAIKEVFEKITTEIKD